MPYVTYVLYDLNSHTRCYIRAIGVARSGSRGSLRAMRSGIEARSRLLSDQQPEAIACVEDGKFLVYVAKASRLDSRYIYIYTL